MLIFLRQFIVQTALMALVISRRIKQKPDMEFSEQIPDLPCTVGFELQPFYIVSTHKNLLYEKNFTPGISIFSNLFL